MEALLRQIPSSPHQIAAMTGNNKRKWSWDSRSVFASKGPSKVAEIDRTILDAQDATSRLAPSDMSLDGCSTKDVHQRAGLTARMRRNGSKFLSIVGFQRSSGTLAFTSLLTLH